MKKPISHNFQIIKFVWILLLIAGFSGAATAATFTVTKVTDTNDGVCDSDCSLREAIVIANTSVNDDVITFDVGLFATAQIITLTLGELRVSNGGKLSITGLQTALLTISGNNASRIFFIDTGANATIGNVHITAGNASGAFSSGDGGGIIVNQNSTLTINNSIINNNHASKSGGGVFNIGTLIINNSNISGNSGPSGGGGISSAVGSLNLNNSTVSNNTADNNAGGGVYKFSSPATITNSVISSNSAGGKGGGIMSVSGELILSNSTVTANTTTNGGGGVCNFTSDSTMTISDSTISNNTTSSSRGGGVFNNGTLNVHNTIIGDNTITGSATAPDFAGNLTSQGFNLIENTTGTNIIDNTFGNITGQEPMLGALQDNGGRTQTRSLLAGSPAIDAGDPINFPPIDQRGAARPLDGDLNGSALPDIGAFEVGAKIVTKYADTNDGICDADCSLREAVIAANNSVANDSIVFSSLFNSAQTITLSNGELVVANNGTLTISGASANLLTISGNNASRVLYFKESVTATISDLRISEGNGMGTFVVDLGGGIYTASNSHITLNNLIVSNNSSAGGGGLCNDNGNVNINTSTFLNNFASFGQGGGGGIGNFRGGLMTVNNSLITNNTSTGGGAGVNNNLNSTINLINSTVSNNSVSGSSGFGGGLSSNGVTNIINSTVSNNTASQTGGGIFTGNAAPVTITNSTIIGNSTIANGGGLGNFGNSTMVTVINVTVSNNRARNGGGIYNTGTLNSRNTIIADNTATQSLISPQDYSGTLNSQGYNLIENLNGTIITGTTTGNILGRDPQLAPLRNNGGATQTVALLPTSPAIDAADPNNFPATDQRGVTRPQDGDLNGTALPDIGAYERQVTAFRATKIDDTNDGVCDSDCSLREAITATNTATTLDNAIIFNASDFGTTRTILLTGGELQITNPNGTFVITGPGANLLTISGNNQSRVFFINSGANATFNGVKITNGNGIGTVNSGFGGGILNNGGILILNNSIVSGNRTTTNGGGAGLGNITGGRLTITKSTISNNTSNNFDGGGISNSSESVVNLIDSTLSGNQANSGGGIYNFGTLEITNSTISGNSAILFGGGILNDGLFGAKVSLTSSTISNNTAGNQGGGVGNVSGTVNSGNSIFADNAANNSAPDFSGNLISQGYNLIENTNGTTITGTTIGNILGQDPQLLPLGNYGGITQTHALKSTSPAIDKGNSFGSITDQRGQIRPYDFPNVPNASAGNGADIGAFERQANEIFRSTLFDFDGDTKADISVFRPSNGIWYLLNSQSGFGGIQFGASTDKLVPADYDGDGKTDIAVFRGDTWFIQRTNLGFTNLQFGQAGDIPVPADYDNDGKADIAVYRPSSGTWFLQRSQLGLTGIQFGIDGDIPMPGDFDGDGKADLALFRPSNGIWYILGSTQGFYGIQFGAIGDKLVPADYDGDGKTDLAVFRPSTATWYINRSQLGSTVIQFGISTDIPVPADYDGDGKADIAVYRNDTWFIQRSTAGFTGVQFGGAADQPIPSAFAR